MQLTSVREKIMSISKMEDDQKRAQAFRALVDEEALKKGGSIAAPRFRAPLHFSAGLLVTAASSLDNRDMAWVQLYDETYDAYYFWNEATGGFGPSWEAAAPQVTTRTAPPTFWQSPHSTRS